MTTQENITVHIKHGSIDQVFSGKPEEVWLLTNKFFNQLLPTFEIANRLTLNVDLQDLVKDCEGIIGFTPGGPCLLAPRTKLTDNETLSLLLLAGYVASRLGKAATDEVTRENLQTKLGKDAKILSTRLSELVKSETAARTDDDKYRMTALGLTQMQKEILPRIRAKVNG